jgi:predicted transcriptional regulator
MRKYLFISIKEVYAQRILEGTKKIELRKSKPNVSQGDYVILYCTSPVKAIVGMARVENLIVNTPEEMWQLHSHELGIDMKDYQNYYNDSDKAVGIVLSGIEKFVNTICLSQIKRVLPAFSPPQTYKYFLNFIPSSDYATLVLTPGI